MFHFFKFQTRPDTRGWNSTLVSILRECNQQILPIRGFERKSTLYRPYPDCHFWSLDLTRQRQKTAAWPHFQRSSSSLLSKFPCSKKQSRDKNSFWWEVCVRWNTLFCSALWKAQGFLFPGTWSSQTWECSRLCLLARRANKVSCFESCQLHIGQED